MAENINIGGRLHSTATGNVVAGANEILDDTKGKKQSVVNAENDAHFEALDSHATDTDNDIESIDNRIHAIEEHESIMIEGGNLEVVNTGEDIQPGSGAVATANALADAYGYLVESPEWIYVLLDAEKRILAGLKSDGSIEWSIGVPTPVKTYITNAITEIKNGTEGTDLDGLNKIIVFLNEFSTSDTLKDLLNTKVDKEEGKSLVDAEYADGVHYIDNPEFVYVKTDAEDKILWAIKSDGSIYYGAGVPQQVIDYINEKIAELSLDEYEDIVAFLNDLEKGDKTLQDLLNEKVDKVEGKSLIPTQYINEVENPEFVKVVTDSEDKILYAVRVDGGFYFGAGVPQQVIDYVIEHTDTTKEELLAFINTKVDKEEGKSLIDEGVADSQSVVEDPEGRHEVTTDSEDKIIAYRKPDGTKVENVGFESPKIATDSLSLSESGMTEFQQALKNSGFKPGGNYDFSDSEFVEIPMPTSCALVNIGVDSQAGAKGMDIETTIEFYWGGYYFKKPIILNAQGDSSMAYWIKNQGFDINDGSKIKIGSLVPQDSFHLKKFYIDAFRGQSVVAYWLTEQVYKTRSYGERRPWDYLNNGTTTTNGIGKFKQDFDTGALSHPDGFPVHVFFKGKDAGIYSFNLKKHRDNYLMKKDSSKNIILDGKIGSAEMFLGTIDWTAFEIRNPKSLKTVDGNKYDGDHPTEITGDPSVDETTAEVKEYIERLSGAYASINSNKTKATFEEYFLPNFFIDYFLISNVVWHQDGFWKNWIWCTWDGNKWAPTIYDLDSIFGMYPNGTHIVPAGEYQNPGANIEAWTNTNTLLGSNVHIASQLWYLYKEDIKLRYKELRDSGIFTTENIVGLLEKWLNKLGYDNLKNDIENVCAYEGIPQTPSYRNGEGNYEKHPNTGGFYNSIMRVKKWLDEHFAYLDSANIFNYNQN